jgi:hypothetical protein
MLGDCGVLQSRPGSRMSALPRKDLLQCDTHGRGDSEVCLRGSAKRASGHAKTVYTQPRCSFELLKLQSLSSWIAFLHSKHGAACHCVLMGCHTIKHCLQKNDSLCDSSIVWIDELG